MATAADIPPELFENILRYIYAGIHDGMPFDLFPKGSLKDVRACSLTCSFWARLCREQLFQSIWIKDYHDIYEFSSLVSSTPSSLTPISEYIQHVTLSQRVGDRLWLHLLRMQPSLFSFMGHAYIYIHIVDNDSRRSGQSKVASRSTYSNLFSCVPRSLPMLFHQCDVLTIDNPHFRTPNDLQSLLSKFSCRLGSRHSWQLVLSNVTWTTQPCLQSDLYTRNAFMIFPYGDTLRIERSLYGAETAWLAYSAIMQSWARAFPTSRGETKLVEFLPTAQLFVLEIAKLMCRSYPITNFSICSDAWDTMLYESHCLRPVCSLVISGHEAVVSKVAFRLYTSVAAHPAPYANQLATVDNISVVRVSRYGLPASQNSRGGMMSFPWKEIVELCAGQDGFAKLQLEFSDREELAQFVLTHREALIVLQHQIGLFYNSERSERRAADLAILEDLGGMVLSRSELQHQIGLSYNSERSERRAAILATLEDLGDANLHGYIEHPHY